MVTKGNAQLLITQVPDDLLTREKLEESEERRLIVVPEDPLDLSGAAVDEPCFHTERNITITAVWVIYTEATSADAGVEIRLGREGDTNYFVSHTSDTSEAQYNSVVATLVNADLVAGQTLIVGTAGGKTGTGEFLLMVEYYID